MNKICTFEKFIEHLFSYLYYFAKIFTRGVVEDIPNNVTKIHLREILDDVERLFSLPGCPHLHSGGAVADLCRVLGLIKVLVKIYVLQSRQSLHVWLPRLGQLPRRPSLGDGAETGPNLDLSLADLRVSGSPGDA